MYSIYFSQFVHGLSLGVLPENDNFEALMSVGICLQRIVMDELRDRFNQDSALSNNISSEDFALITSLLSEDYRNKIRRKVCEE